MRISPLQSGTVNIDRKSAVVLSSPVRGSDRGTTGARLGQAESKGTS